MRHQELQKSLWSDTRCRVQPGEVWKLLVQCATAEGAFVLHERMMRREIRHHRWRLLVFYVPEDAAIAAETLLGGIHVVAPDQASPRWIVVSVQALIAPSSEQTSALHRLESGTVREETALGPSDRWDFLARCGNADEALALRLRLWDEEIRCKIQDEVEMLVDPERLADARDCVDEIWIRRPRLPRAWIITKDS